MVRAIKQIVTIQAGGRVDFKRPELPAGSEAEVIVLVSAQPPDGDCIGLFADEPDLLDSIVAQAHETRANPLRLPRGQNRS